MMVDARMMAVIAAIKQSIETSGTPGLSVNGHPNPFFLNVNGAIDLAKAAELVLLRLEVHDAVAARKAKEADAATAASAVDGH